MKKLINHYKNWQYKNTTFLVLSIILLIYFADSNIVRQAINIFGNLGYIGAFVVGVFFVSIFTVTPSIIVLYDLADKLNPIAISLLAGLGAVLGDFLIFKFLKNNVFEELGPLLARFSWIKLVKDIFRTPYFSWIIPLIGAIIIASPFPDELGISIMGLSKIKNWQFILISFVLNSIGILIIVFLARIT